MQDEIFQIQVLAHQLWEKAGYPEGRDQEFWYEAEKKIKEKLTNGNEKLAKIDDCIIEGIQIQLNTEQIANL